MINGGYNEVDRNSNNYVLPVNTLRTELHTAMTLIGLKEPMYQKMIQHSDCVDIDDIKKAWKELNFPPMLINAVCDEITYNHVRRGIEQAAEYNRRNIK